MMKIADCTLDRMSRFLFESMMLKRTLRTGYAFLGKGKESVAAHTFGVAMIAFILSRMSREPVDLERLLLMCLFHDLPEARTGDANAVYKKYVKINEEQAVEDMLEGLPIRGEIKALIEEWKEHSTYESMLARDADQLDMLLSLKEKMDLGSKDAELWIPYVKRRLKTRCARQLAEALLEEHWASWWMKKFIEESNDEKTP